MTAMRYSRTILGGLLSGGALCLALSLSAAAQVQTSTSETKGEAVRNVTVERGEIVFIDGNNVVVKMEDGSMRHFDNVPDSARIMVDGKSLGVHDLKVGMKVEKQTITTTTPKVITTVQTVEGTVWHVSPPNSVILTLENGKNQSFKIPKGQKFTVDGQSVDAFGLKKGMKISAQKVVEVPETVINTEYKRTGVMPPPPPAPKQDVPMLVVVMPAVAPAPTETAAAEPAPAKLPKTASELPLVGMLGALLCSISLAGMAIRRLGVRFSTR